MSLDFAEDTIPKPYITQGREKYFSRLTLNDFKGWSNHYTFLYVPKRTVVLLTSTEAESPFRSWES